MKVSGVVKRNQEIAVLMLPMCSLAENRNDFGMPKSDVSD